VDIEAIEKANFSVVLDAINSSGGIVVPALLNKLGVKKVTVIHGEPTGNFAHNPEPLPEHLSDLSNTVVKQNADLGISVDPDVDRLAFVCEDGEMFGEEYTLVAVADYILQKNKKGNTVSNLSSTRALRDVTEAQGGSYSASAVGEVNVVKMMKDTNAVIGGEGNGGIILPELHYGRDALVGIAIFLTHLAKYGKTVSMLRKTYPGYFISKNKIELTPQINVDKVLADIKEKYKSQTHVFALNTCLQINILHQPIFRIIQFILKGIQQLFISHKINLRTKQ
jgi:phosphomannomutase